MAQKWKYREHIGKQGKFRVGDLVTVSAYALTTEQNDSLLSIDHGKLIGLVTDIDENIWDKYPIRVQWINTDRKNLPKNFFFRELKRKRS